MTYIRSLAALAVLISMGALYNISLGAPAPVIIDSLEPSLRGIEGTESAVAAPQVSEIESQEVSENMMPVQEEEEVPDEEPLLKKPKGQEGSRAVDVPFYSQFDDISDPAWKKIGCGIASLAMVIDYYKPAVAVDILLTQGVAAGAYLQNAGWTYVGLIGVGHTYGLEGSSHDLAPLSQKVAFEEFREYVKDGPVIASVHYKFDPESTIPHLVVINEIVGDRVYYNDPAVPTGGREISADDFLKAWKKRFIVIRPA